MCMEQATEKISLGASRSTVHRERCNGTVQGKARAAGWFAGLMCSYWKIRDSPSSSSKSTCAHVGKA